MARQNSGTLARFAKIFSDTPRMASEIENYADVVEGMRQGYVAFGAGGFFGEKRRVNGPEFSLAAKLTKAVDHNGTLGFSAKLGDCSEVCQLRPCAARVVVARCSPTCVCLCPLA